MNVRERNQIPVKDTWRLEDIFESDVAWEDSFQETKAKLADMTQYQHTLRKSAQHLKAVLDAQADRALKIERLYAYAHMRRDQDNAQALYQGMTDRAMAIAVEFDSIVSFIVPEIMEIDEGTLNAWRNDPLLKTYSHILGNLVRGREHTLSKPEERLLSMAGEVTSAPQTIYQMLDNADIRFPSVQTPEGEVEISHGNFIHILQEYERDIREETFEKFYETYEGLQNTYAAALSSSIKSDIFVSKARNFPSALEASLHSDRVPLSVYDSLIEAVHQKLPAMYRYMDLRKRALGLEKLHMYDIYAPLSSTEMRFDYSEAQQVVLEGLQPLGKEYGEILQVAFNNRWIDVYENRAKSSGAYCWGCYGTHPYVLMNYQPNIDSVFTLAHEMGHAMHSYYSDRTQEYVNAQYKILVAEVASTVNEVLLITYLLQKEKDKAKKLRLLNYYLEQFRTTVYRQVMFAEFEKITHEMAEEGKALTAEAFSQTYYNLNELYYGSDMYIDKKIGMEWARISHFYNAFYVYKYATGFSAAVALAKAILEEGRPAVERYHTFLRSGGSDYPLTLLQNAGVDLTAPDPVISALEVFESTLNQLEKMI